MCNTTEEYRKVYPNRDNYLRKDSSDYDKWLMNPDCSVLPCMTFVEDKGPLIETCRKHNSGYNKDHLHLPHQPHKILASDKGNQLFHAVIETRTIKPMKANKYSNTF